MEHNEISVVEALFLLVILTVPLDLAEILLSFTGVTILLSIADFFSWILVMVFFSFKGGHAGRLGKRRLLVWFTGNVLEFIPILEMLPIRSVLLIWMIRSWNKEAYAQEGAENKKQDTMGKFEKIGADFVRNITNGP